MLNPPDFDKLILDPGEAAQLLGSHRQLESFATKSRNQDFHALFPDISPAEILCDDFSCAWQKEVLLQGRLYVTQRHIYFYAKILWVYTIIIPLKDVVAIERRNDSVSGIFPNSIWIKTDKEEYFFASFVTREYTIDLLLRLWKNFSRYQSIPMKKLNSSLDFDDDSEEEQAGIELYQVQMGNHSRLESDFFDSEGLDKSPVVESWDDTPVSKESSKSNNKRPKLKAHSESSHIPIPQKSGSFGRTESTQSAPEARRTSFSRKSPDQIQSFQMLEKTDLSSKYIISKQETEPLGLKFLAREPDSTSDAKGNEGPQIIHQKPVINPPVIDETAALVVLTPMVSFSPIPCDCKIDSSKFKVLIDHSFQTSVENLWKILFGSVSSTDGFMKKFWIDLGYKGIKISAWESNPASSGPNEGSNMNVLLEDMRAGHIQKLEYIVPSTNPIGPKEIQTFVKNQVIAKEPNSPTICLLQISTTPFVTSGDCFEVHMKTCLTHHGYGLSKLRVAVQVVFNKSTWIKMVIDKAAKDALSTYFEKLSVALDSHLANNIPATEKPTEVTETRPKEPEFTNHPLEKELNALKNEEKGLRISSRRDLKILQRISSIDITWIMFIALLYVSYRISIMHVEITSLKRQIEEFTRVKTCV